MNISTGDAIARLYTHERAPVPPSMAKRARDVGTDANQRPAALPGAHAATQAAAASGLHTGEHAFGSQSSAGSHAAVLAAHAAASAGVHAAIAAGVHAAALASHCQTAGSVFARISTTAGYPLVTADAANPTIFTRWLLERAPATAGKYAVCYFVASTAPGSAAAAARNSA
jgi:hypothetical protein